MPFPATTSTTSHLVFQSSFSSSTHPSLPAAATAHRNVVRSALKIHKRLPAADQASHLTEVVSSLTDYLKYLQALDYALSGKPIAGEEVDITLMKDVEVEWRPVLASTGIPGRDVERTQGKGLDYEIHFVHQTYSVFQTLLARQALLGLYSSTSVNADQRTAFVQTATKHLKTAYSVHNYLNQRANSSDGPPNFPQAAVDISSTTQTALQRLAHAEYNLLCVLKDDPYPAILIQSRNQDDKEWMIKAPTIPKVRAQVLTRLCVGAAEHAASASATLKAEGKRMLKELTEYVDDVRRTARARACRFQALDSDAAGQTGQGIAWLQAGLNELGIELTKDGSKSSGLSKLKASWTERREDKRIVKGSSRWGSDGGKSEESRILEYLERKMTKSNNAVGYQLVPEWKPLLGKLPSGMNMPIDETWKVVLLAEDELARMRAPMDDGDLHGNGGESSGEEDGNDSTARKGPAGSFPGTDEHYTASRGTSYF